MRYFFNQLNGESKPDEVGLELANIQEARLEAIRRVGVVTRDDPSLVLEQAEFRVEATDDKQLLLFTVIVLALDSAAGVSLAASQAYQPSG